MSFTTADLALAREFGDRRLAEKVIHNRAPKSDDGRPDDWDAQRRQYTEGVLCEMLVARWLGKDVYKDWLETRAYVPNGAIAIPCDVGESIQVRQTIWSGPGAKLIRHKSEPADDKVFVLCVARLERREGGRTPMPALSYVEIKGWAYAHEIDTFDAADDPEDRTGLSRAAFTRKASLLRDPNTIPAEAVRCSPPSPSSCSGATPAISRGMYASGPSDTYKSELLQASASRGAPQN